eukprot:2185893-Pleurochrysis_carterae.AAC.1
MASNAAQTTQTPPLNKPPPPLTRWVDKKESKAARARGRTRACASRLLLKLDRAPREHRHGVGGGLRVLDVVARVEVALAQVDTHVRAVAEEGGR